MPLFNTLTSLLVLSSSLVAHAQVTQDDFSGRGNIFVLKSDNVNTATPDSKVGCLDATGRFIKGDNNNDCGVFTRRADYPYTLSSPKGNCTFNNDKYERNTDSKYGWSDFAWTCDSYAVEIYDELYTINGFKYTFLCSGDINCFYDAKKVPGAGENVNLWPFRWGSQQMGITPGHVQLQLLWNKVGDQPRAEGADFPGPRLSMREGVQVPLQGPQIK